MNKKYISNPSIMKSYILKPSNNMILENIDANIIPVLIILGKIPFSFAVQVKYASIGEKTQILSNQ